jgi:hypothetical protein
VVALSISNAIDNLRFEQADNEQDEDEHGGRGATLTSRLVPSNAPFHRNNLRAIGVVVFEMLCDRYAGRLSLRAQRTVPALKPS